MVRKVMIYIITACLLLVATCCPVAAADYTTYDGNISTSYLTYFRDILSNVSINDNYVFFRSGQYTYDLVVGDLEYNGGVFVLADIGKHYTIDTSGSSYTNNYYTYSVNDIDSFSLTTGNKLVYSDLGDFPQLEERGSKYEILQTITICIACLSVVIRSIFNYSKRK